MNFADGSRVFRSKRGLRSPERQMWVDRAESPQHTGPAATFFSAAGRPVRPLLFSLSVNRVMHMTAALEYCECPVSQSLGRQSPLG